MSEIQTAILWVDLFVQIQQRTRRSGRCWHF